MPNAGLRVLVAGGGIAGVEGLLAVRDLAGDRVELTLVSPDERFRLRPFAVAAPFGLGRPREVPHARIAQDARAEWVRASVAEIDDAGRELRTDDGRALGFDALLVAVGARMGDAVEHAMTWRPEGAAELFGGLLRDIEGGYSKKVAFVVPAGAVWPLPAYELALMTAREADASGVRPEITVVTPEPEPLALFGRDAAAALAGALEAAGVRLITGAVARVERSPRLHLVTEPGSAMLEIDRVVAMPELLGPGLRGVASNGHGFILTGPDGRVHGCERTWAAGDGVASNLKLGGLATSQARRAARQIARLAGVEVPAGDDEEPVLDGVLMTGAAPVAVDQRPLDHAAGAPLWWPARKVAGRYLEAYLGDDAPPATAAPAGGVRVRIDAAIARALDDSPLYSRADIGRLGRRMHEYSRHRRLG